MTPMSRFFRRVQPTSPDKHLKLQEPGQVARGLLPYRWILRPVLIAMLVTTAACPFPSDLEQAAVDGGQSSPPVMLSAQPAPEFSFPGPMILERGDSRVLTLEVEDTDIGDSLFLRLYVDYNRPQPTPPWAECQAAPTGNETRIVDCPTATLCNGVDVTNEATDHVLEAMVSDRAFIPDSDPAAEGQPAFRAVSDPQRGAYSLRSWILRCTDPDA